MPFFNENVLQIEQIDFINIFPDLTVTQSIFFRFADIFVYCSIIIYK